MNSIWSENSKLTGFEALKGDVKTDVLIIGGGMAGILCAYCLDKAGVDYLLVEANTLCSGITKNTTAKITSQHGLIYDKLIRSFGEEKAKMYLEANEKAVKDYRRLCLDIDCGFENKDSFVYSLDDRKKLEKELEALSRLGYKTDICDPHSLPLKTVGAVRFGGQAQFDPLRFISGISRGLKLYEHTKVRELIGNTAVTEHGRIKAEKIIVATHFPIINKHGAYFLKMYQHRSYVLALENAADVNGMYIDESGKGLSFRNYGELLLLGGGAHRTGKKGKGWSELEDFAKINYPNAHEVSRWATQDCMTLDGVPYIGVYSKGTPELFVATGFNKWGMTSSMVAANVLTDKVLGRKNEYEAIFEPSRSILRPQLAVNVFEALVGLLYPTVKRCPHMGCALKWNPYERSWDCSCHGSRFTKDGELIDDPATDDLKSGK